MNKLRSARIISRLRRVMKRAERSCGTGGWEGLQSGLGPKMSSQNQKYQIQKLSAMRK